MTTPRSEVRIGVTRTSRYVLSHHEPHEWDRCHAIRLPRTDRHLRVCARCSGIYPGIASGVALVGSGTLPVLPWLVAVLPAFALVEWARTQFTPRRGSNAARTTTGFMLGFSYGIGLLGVLRGESRIGILLVGVGYAVLASGALWVTYRQS
jgi:uncharacterized membrane protein